jgi:glycosyltransferase involved in cell wall biosynthesis
MKILWFTNSSSLYEVGKHHYHGGGWIESLEEILANEPSIDLAVSFFHRSDSLKMVKNNTIYYPIQRNSGKKNPLKTVKNNWRGNLEDVSYIRELLEVIEDFKPDIINVFGTEGLFSSIQEYTDIPVVIHLQGLINPCLNAYFPPGVSKWDFIFDTNYLLDNLLGRSPFFGYKRFVKQAEREAKNLMNAKFVMGRTEWDRRSSNLYNKNVIYFHVNEVLRPVFYNRQIKLINNRSKIIIISTISPTIYKGIDLVLKTANLLKNELMVDFEWKLIGLDSKDKLLKGFEKKFKLSHASINIHCIGRKNSEDLFSIMNNADLFVHPSYIDNSSNSVCEAQIMGLPIIACNVGGLPSLIANNESGILIPSNGLHELAFQIRSFFDNRDIFEEIVKKGQTIAQARHERSKIKEDLLEAYFKIKVK